LSVLCKTARRARGTLRSIGKTHETMPPPSPRVALITGATGGLGLQVAKNLARKGLHVVLVGREGEGEARRLTKAKDEVAGASAIPCDFSSLADVRRAAAVALEKHRKLDFVLLNAAVWPSAAAPASSTQQHQQALTVNHLSQFLLVRLLLPALRRADSGARCVFVSSELHKNTSPLPPTPGALFGEATASTGPSPRRSVYACTKLLNIWSARELQRREPPTSRVRFAAVSPGFVPSTGLSRNAAGSGVAAWAFRTLAPWLPFAVSLDEGARRLESALLLGDAAAEEAGGAAAVYYTKGEPTAPSAAAMDDRAAAEAWRLTEDRLGKEVLAPLQE
jgi:NAD(P)-dependent dehydrogenase (short-subunit alcohol dehydrogenase family)